MNNSKEWFTERNKDFARRVLEGDSFSQVAREYNRSPALVRIMVHRACRKANRETYMSLPKEKTRFGYGTPSLGELRYHKDAFLSKINTE